MDDKAAAAGSDIGEFDGAGVCGSKDDIGATGIISIGSRALGANDEISLAIAVDVTGRAEGDAAEVLFRLTMDDKAAAAGGDIGELDGRGVVCFAKDDIGTAGIFSIGVGVLSTNDQISNSIGVDVTSRAGGAAAVVVFTLTLNDKAAAAGSDVGELDGRGVVCFAKDDVSASGAISWERGTNDQISESIAVDVASRADGNAAGVVISFTIDDKAAAAGSDIGEFDGRGVVC